MNSITRQYAKNMINSVLYNKTNATQDALKFFKHANDNNIQGMALVSYYTELNKMPLSAKYNFPETIQTINEKNKALNSETKKFISVLTKNYPKTLNDRISLASNGSVVDGGVKPKSVFKKILTVINRFMRVEE